MSQSVFMLTAQQGQTLVRLARKTLMQKFGLAYPADQALELSQALRDPIFKSVCATFVTLKKNHQLRGCIGTLQGHEPLDKGVPANALNAAFNDPRFNSLKAEELDHVRIEVSVLSEPRPLVYADAEDLIAKLRPGIDGVTIRKGFAGSTFLPQVWDQLPRVEDFLSHLCRKAGLSADAWRRDRLSVETYQVQYFEEAENLTGV